MDNPIFATIQCKRKGKAWDDPESFDLCMIEPCATADEAMARFDLAGGFDLARKHLGARVDDYKLTATAMSLRELRNRQAKRAIRKAA